MCRNKKIKVNTFFLKIVLGALIASLISVAIVFLFKGYLSKRFAGDPYKYFRYYYDFVNYVPEGVPEFPAEEEIIIIDAHDSSLGTRDGIARLLDSLDAWGPRAVGLDVIFPRTNESTRQEDSLLTDAVRRFSAPLVVAARRQDRDSLEHSFFTRPAKLKYGTVNAQSFYSFSPCDSVKGCAVPKMVVLLAREACPRDKSVSRDETVQIVNYTNRLFRRIDRWEQLSRSVVNGKIILIGDCRDDKDRVDLPFKLEGSYICSGVVVNAYQLASLVHPERSFRPMPVGLSVFICFLLILAYSFFTCCMDRFKGRSRALKALFLLAGPFLVIGLEFLTLWGLVIIIKLKNIVPNLALFMAALPFIGRCCQFVELLFGGKDANSSGK